MTDQRKPEESRKQPCRQAQPDLHYCACRQCGEPMILTWDGTSHRYGGMCAKCGQFSPLRSAEDAHPPRPS